MCFTEKVPQRQAFETWFLWRHSLVLAHFPAHVCTLLLKHLLFPNTIKVSYNNPQSRQNVVKQSRATTLYSPMALRRAELKKSERDDAWVRCFSRQQVETQPKPSAMLIFITRFLIIQECQDRRFGQFSYSTMSSEIPSLPLFWRIKHQLYGRAGSLKLSIGDSDRSLFTIQWERTLAFLCRKFKQVYSLPCPTCYPYPQHLQQSYEGLCISWKLSVYCHFWTNFHFLHDLLDIF